MRCYTSAALLLLCRSAVALHLPAPALRRAHGLSRAGRRGAALTRVRSSPPAGDDGGADDDAMPAAPPAAGAVPGEVDPEEIRAEMMAREKEEYRAREGEFADIRSRIAARAADLGAASVSEEETLSAIAAAKDGQADRAEARKKELKDGPSFVREEDLTKLTDSDVDAWSARAQKIISDERSDWMTALEEIPEIEWPKAQLVIQTYFWVLGGVLATVALVLTWDNLLRLGFESFLGYSPSAAFATSQAADLAREAAAAATAAGGGM